MKPGSIWPLHFGHVVGCVIAAVGSWESALLNYGTSTGAIISCSHAADDKFAPANLRPAQTDLPSYRSDNGCQSHGLGYAQGPPRGVPQHDVGQRHGRMAQVGIVRADPGRGELE